MCNINTYSFLTPFIVIKQMYTARIDLPDNINNFHYEGRLIRTSMINFVIRCRSDDCANWIKYFGFGPLSYETNTVKQQTPPRLSLTVTITL